MLLVFMSANYLRNNGKSKIEGQMKTIKDYISETVIKGQDYYKNDNDSYKLH
jgi:hypothetical protein